MISESQNQKAWSIYQVRDPIQKILLRVVRLLAILSTSLSLVTWVVQFGPHCDAQHLTQPSDNSIMSNTTLSNSHLLPSYNSRLLPPYTPQNPFCLDSVKNPWSVRGWKIVKCSTTIITGPEITDSVLLECVNMYNTHFGVWSEVAEQFDCRVKAG